MILLTGAAGYIGSMTLDMLKKEFLDEEIIAIDNFAVGQVKNNGEKKILKIDICNKEEVDSIMKGVEVIIHFAGVTGIQQSEDEPFKAITSNILGTKNLIDSAVNHGVKHFLYASSSAVYGEFSEEVIEENLLDPINFYGYLRKSCEDLLLLAQKQHNLKVTIFRQSNIFGKSFTNIKDTVINIFSQNILKKEALIINGSGQQVRNFLHVRDTSNAYLLALKTGTSGIYNLGSSENLSINDIAHIGNHVSKEYLGYSVPIVHQHNENYVNEVSVLNVDYKIKKVKSILNFTPLYSVRDGFIELLTEKSIVRS